MREVHERHEAGPEARRIGRIQVAGVAEAATAVHHRFGDKTTAAHDEHDLGPVPLLVRPLRVGPLRLLAPLAPARTGVRELFVREPRMTRLWERYCIDVGVAITRDASFFEERVFKRMHDARYRVLVVEDGDRYAVRAACVFTSRRTTGYVLELLHDRTVAGMRAASRLLGIALRDLADEGATSVHAWSFAHSGTFPMFARHAFVPLRARTLAKADARSLLVRADEDVEPLVTRRDRWHLSLLDDDRV